MTKSRTIEITIETHEVTQIRQTGRPMRCSVCGAEETGFSVEKATSKAKANEIELARLLETGRIGKKGRVLDICGSSTSDATEELTAGDHITDDL